MVPVNFGPETGVTGTGSEIDVVFGGVGAAGFGISFGASFGAAGVTVPGAAGRAQPAGAAASHVVQLSVHFECLLNLAFSLSKKLGLLAQGSAAQVSQGAGTAHGAGAGAGAQVEQGAGAAQVSQLSPHLCFPPKELNRAFSLSSKLGLEQPPQSPQAGAAGAPQSVQPAGTTAETVGAAGAATSAPAIQAELINRSAAFTVVTS